MKSCSKNHIEIIWDNSLSCWCPMCAVKDSQDYLRGEKEKYKKKFEEIKGKYEPPIKFGGELVEGLFFHDWILNGISTQRKPINHSKKASIIS